MPLLACGFNHKTAPLSIRERVCFVPDNLKTSLADLSQKAQLAEIAILSTCNRTEFYSETESHLPIINWLCQQQHCSPQELQPYLYIHKEQAAVRHLLRVASGLDSMVLGEPQILGQMKDAFAKAEAVGTIGPQLQRLFQYIFAVTKEIRTSTGIGANPVSIAYAAVNLAKHIFSDLSTTQVMVIGAGETIELVMRYLRENKIQKLFILNRTYSRAQSLAEKYHAEAATFVDMAKLLSEVDIIISATTSSIPILGKGTVERVLRQRKHRPMFMVDLAVPRDIEPEVGELADVYLYCIDDLQHVIERSFANRKEAALEAEKVIELQVEHYMRWLRSLDAVTILRSFRAKIEGIRDQEIKNAQALLQQGTSPEAALCMLARNLTNKIMHVPTIQIRQAGYEQDLEILAWVKQLFALEE